MKKMKFVSCVLFSTILIGCGGGGGGTPANIAPEATNKTITLNENQNKQVTLDATDADGNTLTYKVVKAPSHGTFKNAVYTPTAGYVGSDTFTYIANDGTADSEPATVTITITADFDGDDISDAIDTDDDGDTVLDIDDAFPLDVTESIDTDGDGIGNNADSDDDGDGISDADETAFGSDPLDATSKAVTISGKITYELVHVNSANNELDYNNISQESVKNVKVDIIDAGNNIVKTTTTDDSGNYSVSLLSNKDVKVRVYAKIFKENKWDVKVIDNTNNNAQYVIEGELVTSGTSNSARDLKAIAATKNSPPFAILDSVYSAMKKVLDVNSSAVFPELNMNWSVNNIESGTYYDGDKTIMLQGDQKSDSDEYDNHIIIHEWGHYFEEKFSRSDNIGGVHSDREALDIRLAFGEGFGNALSAIVTDDPIYFDTMGNIGWHMNIETASHNNAGWFSEASIQRILYDLYDSNDDGSDSLSLGFKPLYDVLAGAQKVTPAFTSIFSFITALKDENVDNQEGIDSIVSSEDIATIDDIYGAGRTNRANSYPYHDLTIGGNVSIHTSSSDGSSNNLSNHQYVKFAINNTGDYYIKVEQTNGTNSNPVITCYSNTLFRNIWKVDNLTKGGIEQATKNIREGEYILDITDSNNISTANYKVTITQYLM